MPLDFPSSPSNGQVYQNWQWDGQKWVAIPDAGSGGSFPEAPTDGFAYGRQNANWTPVLMRSGDVIDGGNF